MPAVARARTLVTGALSAGTQRAACLGSAAKYGVAPAGSETNEEMPGDASRRSAPLVLTGRPSRVPEALDQPSRGEQAFIHVEVCRARPNLALPRGRERLPARAHRIVVTSVACGRIVLLCRPPVAIGSDVPGYVAVCVPACTDLSAFCVQWV